MHCLKFYITTSIFRHWCSLIFNVKTYQAQTTYVVRTQYKVQALWEMYVVTESTWLCIDYISRSSLSNSNYLSVFKIVFWVFKNCIWVDCIQRWAPKLGCTTTYPTLHTLILHHTLHHLGNFSPLLYRTVLMCCHTHTIKNLNMKTGVVRYEDDMLTYVNR